MDKFFFATGIFWVCLAVLLCVEKHKLFNPFKTVTEKWRSALYKCKLLLLISVLKASII